VRSGEGSTLEGDLKLRISEAERALPVLTVEGVICAADDLDVLL
jgi:hypothetical protein